MPFDPGSRWSGARHILGVRHGFETFGLTSKCLAVAATIAVGLPVVAAGPAAADPVGVDTITGLSEMDRSIVRGRATEWIVGLAVVTLEWSSAGSAG